MALKIGEVAALAKVSIRTLHHYDEIGLLTPSGRTESGYRLYSRADLEKLQQIRFYRMLEMPLEKIRSLMNAPGFDRMEALREQRELLCHRAEQTATLIALIDRTISDSGKEKEMNFEDMFEAFPEVTPEMMEASEREWGQTEQWQEQQRRISRYGKEEWQLIRQETDAINRHLGTTFSEGAAADSEEAIAAIEAARLHIDKWYFTCPRDLHTAITDMTANDERYRVKIDAENVGLACWMAQAARANAARQ